MASYLTCSKIDQPHFAELQSKEDGFLEPEAV